MSFFRIRNRKLIYLILVVIVIAIVMLLINIACDNCLVDSWGKNYLSLIFTVIIAIIELGDVFKKGKSRKIAIYSCVAALFLVSVWDTGNESIEYSKEAEKRDSLITA